MMVGRINKGLRVKKRVNSDFNACKLFILLNIVVSVGGQSPYILGGLKRTITSYSFLRRTITPYKADNHPIFSLKKRIIALYLTLKSGRLPHILPQKADNHLINVTAKKLRADNHPIFRRTITSYLCWN